MNTFTLDDVQVRIEFPTPPFFHKVRPLVAISETPE